MTVAGAVDVALDIFGGLVTDMAAADLPAGVSPDCQDVAFIPGSVKTRPGLLSIFPAIAGNPTVNYLKTYIPPTGLLRLLALDAAGSLWKESSNGVLSLISSAIVPSSFGKSASLFTREYLAIGDGQNGIDIPRQFDDTNFDRVSQVGPGLAPTAQDLQTTTMNIVASPNGLNPQSRTANIGNLTESGNTVTATVSVNLDPGVKVGDEIIVTGALPSGYNGTFKISAITGANQFQYSNLITGLGASTQAATITFNTTLVTLTANAPAGWGNVGSILTIAGAGVAGYNGSWVVRTAFNGGTTGYLYITGADAPLAGSGGGTIVDSGNITAGVHGISVVFVTRQGYITAPAPPGSWTAAGSKKVIVGNIPIGPPNVIARIILFTLTGQSFYFYSSGITGIANSNFIISDNTTTTVTLDFSDVGLSAQNSADSFFKKVELGECSGVIDYASRLFWWGERAKLQNLVNLTFDGGSFSDSQNGTVPDGWASAQNVYFFTSGGGGIDYTNSVWGGAYTITGDGATAQRGAIFQSVVTDAFGVAIWKPNTSFSIRVKAKRNNTLATGTLNIIVRTAAGFQSGIAITAAQLTTSFQEFVGVLDPGVSPVPSDYALIVYASGTPTNGGIFYIDNIEIYQTAQPFNSSLVRASKVEDPETYDGVTGFMQINENDGQTVRSAFVLRENLYFVKDNYIGVTQDDGTNEPSLWKVTEVSRKVGTSSVNGVAVGEDWAVIAHRSGLYITSGGEPMKISQEIQPTWDRINWNFGSRLWVQVDVQNKRILVGVPLDSATSPNTILTLDYRGMNSAAEIAENTPIHTSYSGKLLVREISRKWSPWSISANSAAVVERFDGTLKVFLGNGAGTGKIYQLTDSQLGTDDGSAISSYYTTYYHFSHDLEQAFQIGAHNKLFTYLAQFVEGNGQLVVSAVFPGGSSVVAASLTLGNPGLRDLELPINVTAARAAFKIQVSNLNEWFRLARFIVDAIKHPTSPVRGWN